MTEQGEGPDAGYVAQPSHQETKNGEADGFRECIFRQEAIVGERRNLGQEKREGNNAGQKRKLIEVHASDHTNAQ
nr:hypothetical protein [Rhizobium sp. R693]